MNAPTDLQKYLDEKYHPENVHFVGYRDNRSIAVYQIHECENVWAYKYYVRKF